MEKKKRTSTLEKLDRQIAYLGNVDFDAAKFSSVRLLTTVVLILLLYRNFLFCYSFSCDCLLLFPLLCCYTTTNEKTL